MVGRHRKPKPVKPKRHIIADIRLWTVLVVWSIREILGV